MFLLTKVVLHRYKRLKLHEIETLTWTPNGNDRLLQAILGGNGSGKSSIVRAATPLPLTPKKDFYDDGYKEVTIEDGANKFICRSSLVGKGEEHSFVYNNEELNTTGQARHQLLLCKQYFNLTPKVHEVLLGNTTFTKMSVGERKEWLTNIATVDYTYALKLFKDSKVALRDVTGAIKLQSTNLVKLEEAMLTPKEFEELVTRKTSLENTLQTLYISKGKLRTLPIDTGISITERTRTYSKALELSSTLTKEVLSTSILESEKKLAIYREKMNDINVRLDAFKKNINYSEKNKELEIVNNDIKKITDTFFPGVRVDNCADIAISLSYNYIGLTTALGSLSSLITKTPSRDELSLTMESLRNVQTQLGLKREVLYTSSGELKTIVASLAKEEVECIKCGHTWKIGYDKARHDNLTIIISKTTETIQDLEKKEKELKSILEEIDKRIDAISLINKHFTDGNMWLIQDLLIDSNLLKLNEDYNVTINALFEVKNRLSDWTNINPLLSKKKTLEDEIAKSASIEMDTEDVAVLTKEIHELSSLITLESGSIDRAKNSLRNLNNLATHKDRLKLALTNEKHKLLNEANNTKKKLIEENISSVLEESAKVNDMINDYNNREYRLKDMRETVENLEVRKNSLKILVAELSPDTGLIAESIMSFLLEIVTDMNEIIDEIWNYNLEVKPCGVSGSDLDYKFPIRVGDSDEDIPDVSMGSTGIQEIIDLAFKLVSMDKLGLKHSPLILDEFASSFDNIHKDAAFKITDKLVEVGDRQIFLISHFNEQYTTLASADVIVLSNSDLKLDMLSDFNDSKIVQFKN